MNNNSIVLSLSGWIFGAVVFAIGVINVFWGNDTGFGVFIILLTFIYFLPVNNIVKKITGFSIPQMGMLKVFLGIFILWAALGVGELFSKIDLMLADLRE